MSLTYKVVFKKLTGLNWSKPKANILINWKNEAYNVPSMAKCWKSVSPGVGISSLIFNDSSKQYTTCTLKVVYCYFRSDFDVY